ncbi:ATP-binding cassette domain-containing protein [Heliobacillus mobilis]|uniref:ATP-binding cassette domain-containing protein n=1 Tax=Heliobacterium mobile TaxID=28064 RepID=A0A6I3SHF4_HELMO|nr:ATP-binding cassette domain-containing protein [Heliobacterium mobile]MTV48256.1 ATP-binding cassette domain-containing protein [Heliobacterium mobile]
MLTVRNLRKTFVTPQGSLEAIKDVSFQVEKGEIFGVIGFSGAGKSTLIRCLNRLEEPDSGQIFINGRDITLLAGQSLREARKKIGMIFQHFNLFDSRTVWKNISFPMEVARLPTREIAKRVEKLLEVVGLVDKADAYPAQLSGGQKQRVGIARALAMEPELLLIDEATSALDPLTTRSILKLLQDINRQSGVTVVLITHEMDVVRQICHRVAVMEEGRLVEMGDVQEVFNEPKSKTTQLFLQQMIFNSKENDKNSSSAGIERAFGARSGPCEGAVLIGEVNRYAG